MHSYAVIHIHTNTHTETPIDRNSNVKNHFGLYDFSKLISKPEHPNPYVELHKYQHLLLKDGQVFN